MTRSVVLEGLGGVGWGWIPSNPTQSNPLKIRIPRVVSPPQCGFLIFCVGSEPLGFLLKEFLLWEPGVCRSLVLVVSVCGNAAFFINKKGNAAEMRPFAAEMRPFAGEMRPRFFKISFFVNIKEMRPFMSETCSNSHKVRQNAAKCVKAVARCYRISRRSPR